MKWTDLLKREVEDAYRMAFGLVNRVEDGMLEWKPGTGENWMTVGQLLKHMTVACGACCKGIVTGEWGVPEEAMEEGGMLPPAEKMPSVSSVAEARAALEADKTVALEMIDRAGEEDLEHKQLTLPWGSSEVLGKHILDMVNHLNTHKSQLFYYLKLMGQPVNTHHLWGIPEGCEGG